MSKKPTYDELEKLIQELEESKKDRKQLEETLTANYTLLHIAGKTAGFGGWRVDLLKNIATWSDIVADIHEMPRGYSPPLKDAINFYAPEWREKITEVFNDCAENGVPYDEEMEIITKKGARVWVRTNGDAIRNKNGKIVMVQGSFQDITKQKQTEQTLQESEQTFRALFEKAPMGVAYHQMVYDESGKPIDYLFLEANQSYQKLTGVNPVGKLVTEAFPGIEDDPFGWIGKFGEVAKTGKEWRFQQYLQPNDRWYDCVGYQYKPDHFVAAFHEITEQKLVEQALQESEEKYRKLISNISDVIVILDKDGIIKYKSPNITSQFGWKPNDLIGKHGLFMTHPDDKDRIGNQLADLIKNRQKTVRVEYDYLCKDGSYKPIELIAVNLINDPVIGGILANYKDITERKKAGGILKQSEEKYRTMIEHSNDMIWTMDSVGNFTFLNEQAEQITGIKSEDWIGKSFAPLIMDDDLSMISDVFQKSLNGESVQYELRFKKQDDRILTISVNTAPIIKDGTINEIVSFGRDITEQQELRVKLQQAQKMEAIGTLAGGIAHDFNNILSGIFGYSQLAQTNLNNPEKASQQIDQVIKGAQRATELVKQILTFSRQTEYQKQPFKIYLEVKEALKLLRSTIPTTIDIKQKLDSKALILADPTKIHQVVINLCTNAYHAMRKTGGCLTISLTDVEISEPKHLRDNKVLTGNYLKLEVSDTGCGMDEKTLKMAFDPYYTTKKVGAGTGLGLSIVQAIVEEHDGFLDVNSIPDKGTSFYIYFPIIEQKTRSEGPKLDKEFVLRGDETIMIVDDEETIRQSLKEGLEDYGYQIRLYQNGIEALEEFESNPNQFDLIITDMTMPEMTGDELSTKCLTVRPDIPIMLCTGFSENISETRAAELGIRKFVKKPIGNKEFLILIREVLNEIQ